MGIRRTSGSIAVVAALVGGLAVAGAGTGSAATVTVRIGGSLSGCSAAVPGAGTVTADIAAQIEVDAPDTARQGVPTAPLPYRGTASTNLDFAPGTPLRQALDGAGAVTLDATARVFVGYHSPQYPNPEKPRPDFSITGVPVAGNSSLPEWSASGELPPIVFDRAGTEPTLYYQSFDIRVTPRGADGNLTALDTFDVHCIYPPGPYPTHRVEVSPANRHITHDLTARTALTKSGAQADLGAGTLNLDLPGTGTAATGKLFLPNTGTAPLRLLGFIPATASVSVTPSGPVLLTVDGDALTGTVEAAVTVADLAVLGMPLIKANPDCRSTTTLTLTSGAGFTLAGGGPVTGTYDLPAFTGCGNHTGLVDALFAGVGNTLALNTTG
ncbi:hypothetical protein L6E12_29730 [Actinokineospora sp. PR83]|uniref:DUF6801 domain-containing protein n=1 Tax=Actinokineospora sp. PR83 TaxID=2884908 RepID=UPI001F251BE7|nr:DUF6801 domain-containing protein [Actinokineospora sp. PR83]MCG8919959.1 hypothetical protein [Actinokineospora sp. PR83]